ncbi:hypothetical protein CC80DRAFT_488570 [Byssothecium circinans]|uniref:SMP domain-containing protein n=1 Tax=Byssothecium circinans TaxID=147558 RepID=A0A6A5U952_9PLEO|nr:hypothetical protein CC80DRAFT_488570 [Byssothecium circinans]
MSGNASNNNASSGKPMTQADASRIQSTQAKAGNDGAGTFASRAQSSADKNANVAAKGGQEKK